MQQSHLDLLLTYRLFEFSNNKIFLSLGTTYSKGENEYLKKLVLSPDPNFIDIVYSEFKLMNESYLGVISGLTYTYSLFNDRLRIGINSTVRFYPKYPIHLNYGLRLQCNI